MNRFNFLLCKYLRAGFLAPLVFVGCNSEPPDEPVLIPRPRTARRPIKLVPTPKPPDISKCAREFPAPTTKLPDPNGYDLLVQTAQSIQRGGEGSPGTADRLTPAEDLQRQRAFSAKNARALDLVTQALQLPIMVPPARGLRVPEPPYAKLRSLMRLMTQRNRVYAADKQWDKAVNGALDIVQMGTALQNGGNAIGVLVGVAIQSYGYKDAPRWVANCDAKTALAAVKRMEILEAKMANFSPLMPEAKWDGLVELQEILASPNWKQFRRGDEKSMSQFLRTPGARGQTRAFSDSEIQSHYLAAMDKAIAQAKLPYNRYNAPVAGAADPFSENLSGVFTGSDGKNGPLRRNINRARNFAVHRLLQTAFALQAFKQTTGRYPENLSALVGKYLQRVPRDPFAPDSALIYRRDGNEFRLYSVGPDTIDDGGSPITNINVYEKTLGDLMFGYGVLNDGRPQNL